MILDSNVLIALLDPEAPDRVRHGIEALREEHDPHVNEIIFAELSRAYVDAVEVEEMLRGLDVGLARLTLPECHRAGQAFAEYRRRGGERRAILPDFLIGAQAEMRGWPLVTGDRRGFARYFPKLEVIDPLEDEG